MADQRSVRLRLLSRHGRLNGDHDVLDAAFLVVLPALDLLWDDQVPGLPGGGRIADRFFTGRKCGD